ncbi:sugar kinase [Candidatus Geothermarchaeota archaeon]|nr:MAG: sugar kinase [Candidatus Geothermarchaeota archaeon]
MKEPKRVILVPKTDPKSLNENLLSYLETRGVEFRICKNLSSDEARNSDLIMVFGRDRDLLKIHQEIKDVSTPVLGVSPPGEISFLADITTNRLHESLDAILSGNYEIEECLRINVRIDRGNCFYALNEVALFPSRSATLMEYELIVDGKLMWRDYSDGVIISTPMGSTAYAMSAGGPFVMTNASVLIVVPVNSMDLTRRPLIVSNESLIEVCKIHSRCGCHVIIDGIRRVKVKEKIEVRKAKVSAKIVRLNKSSFLESKIFKKILLAEELMKAPPSVKLVLKAIQFYGPMTQRDLVQKTMLPPRTVRYALKILLNKGVIKRRPLVEDVRHYIYYLSEDFNQI